MLIDEVRQLRQRCDSLEEANVELKREMRAMALAQQGVITQTVSGHDELQTSTKGNLSGYASSESSISSDTAAFGM